MGSALQRCLRFRACSESLVLGAQFYEPQRFLVHSFLIPDSVAFHFSLPTHSEEGSARRPPPESSSKSDLP